MMKKTGKDIFDVKLDTEEREFLDAVERGEWKNVSDNRESTSYF